MSHGHVAASGQRQTVIAPGNESGTQSSVVSSTMRSGGSERDRNLMLTVVMRIDLNSGAAKHVGIGEA